MRDCEMGRLAGYSGRLALTDRKRRRERGVMSIDAAGEEPRGARRSSEMVWVVAGAQEILEQTVRVLEESAFVERDLAATLTAMAADDGSRAAARWLVIAKQATAGATAAAKRGEHLLNVARQRAEHADVIRLHHLLAHAAEVLADLAKTEQGIADAMTSLAARGGSDLAAQRRQAAVEAAAGAKRAHDRAQALHQLARTPAARPRSESRNIQPATPAQPHDH